jgi:PAN domain
MRIFAAAAVSAHIVVAPLTCLAQSGFDRPGGDYANAVVRSGDPAVCATRCERDARCRAWSFSYPAAGGGDAICWLKKDVPPRVENACCVSGVRGGGAIEARRDEAIEWGIDRIGGDLRNFDLAADPNGAACKSACEADARCRAWTYERPGYAGASARCYLKSRLTRPRKQPCCISGVVR